MTWESNQDWHLGRTREPYRLPGQLPQLRIDLHRCGWSEVADTAPAFIQRFTQGQKGGSHAY